MADVQLTARWTVSETIALIEIWGCDSIQKKLDGTVRDTEIYRQIQKELSDAGYSRNTVQIKTKVKALRREYRLQRDKLRLSGAGGKITFRFYHEMDKVLGSRDASNPGLITETEILGLEESVPSEMLNTSEESFVVAFDAHENMDHQGTEMYKQSQECSPIPPTPSSHFSSLNGQRSSRRRKKNLKDVIEKTIETTVDKFLQFEREMEEKISEENRVFREKLLDILEKIANK